MEYKLKRKTSLQMLWVAIISMIMVFAGLTSAYVVSTKREDWVSFNLPNAFYISTLLIILSSITFIISKFFGFKELINAGLYFTGKKSNIATSFLYVISVTHLVHVFVAVLVLIFIVYKQYRGRYSKENYLGIELGGLFWHFLDILWIYLFLFFYFIR